MTYTIKIEGLVQGLGFRPFIYKLAISQKLKGEVINTAYGVEIQVNCSQDEVNNFTDLIKLQSPALSKIESIKISQVSKCNFTDFKILQSQNTRSFSSRIPSDIAMCQACQKELEDTNNRRFNYPFITCTHCGPRWSIIKKLPYDRDKTSMDTFEMCKKCQKEYEDPQDRRYHAQTIGCFECGPQLSLFDANAQIIKGKNTIDTVCKLLEEGKIIALKGIGGYHFICDAINDTPVKLLREKKQRPSKPFAVMTQNIQTAKTLASISEQEEELLDSEKRPIVLVKKKNNSPISGIIAPKINQIGLFLAYTPLQHMLLKKFNKPIVATSANISNMPLCSTKDEIMKLSHIWDYCLDNDREILNPCDDSVTFIENNSMLMLRNARGYSPSYLDLGKKTDKKILCLGANQKSTVAICINDKVILSPYIGDLNSLSNINHFKSHINSLKSMYNFEPEIIVCDKHPDYESIKYAKELKLQNPNLKLLQVQHHYAHILATMGINNIHTKVLGISFDGTGYGDDSHLWGGEFFLCDRKAYKRITHFKNFKLLGGEKAIKEPRRIALSFLFELYGEKVLKMQNNTTNSFTKQELQTLFIAWKKGLNSPLSSSTGRLFDAIASILGIVQISSYEGESGLLLESLYDEYIKDFYQFNLDKESIDFSYIFELVLQENQKSIAVSKFFNTLIEIIFSIYKKYNLPLVLSGGVFQNRVLLKLIKEKIPDVILPENFVSNDSAIAYGQAIYASTHS